MAGSLAEGGDAVIAAVNGPASVVRVRDAGGGDAGRPRLAEAEGMRVRVLRVSHAFHSPLTEPMLEEFGAGGGGPDAGRIR